MKKTISIVLLCLFLGISTNAENLNENTSINSISEKKEYFDNGKIKNITKFQNGSEVERINHIYFDTGELDSKITYKNNQIVLKDIYHKSGRLLVSEPYLNDLLNGEVKVFHTNGKLFLVTTFLNGKKEGVSKIYDINEKVIKEFKYSNDNLIEETWYQYYDSGELKQSNSYLNGKKNGIEKAYFKNGNLQWEVTIVDNKLDGTYKEYFSTGELKHIALYKNGKEDGISKQYFKEGVLSWEFYYQDGKRLKTKQYFNNGQIRTEIEYKDEKPFSGYIYDSNGNKTKMTDLDFINLSLLLK
ncbi:toxin-antitoxin system YwqK family antitoxin [Aliarcobacter butzleri]|uniref:toxin-antitoxin system YwqK family antitoxin n=1 Tax=Aliarcobacter butzleri TaxID=28197 RepID=UPI00263D659A|nr:toxin-antitoxin system YwqK family antitoxin [Aliarcobacter butzleri]MDN5128726.1 toxin-antitoxin system YwqK family antitoxin [Aliarcobacter butzleri]